MRYGKWILCEDELPEVDDEFLVTWTCKDCKRPFLAMLEFSQGEGWIIEKYMLSYKDVKVVAWMPLPDAYKG